VTICIPPVYLASENQVHGWNLVDNVLDLLNQREGVTLVVRPLNRVADNKFKDWIGEHFPLMWESGRVVLEVTPPHV